MEVSKTPKKKEDTTMKLKKLLALALAGVMTAATLTACAPLDASTTGSLAAGAAPPTAAKRAL